MSPIETTVKRRPASCFLRLRSALRSFSLAFRQVKLNGRWEVHTVSFQKKHCIFSIAILWFILYVSIYIYTYREREVTYIYIYIHIYIYTYTYIYICIHMRDGMVIHGDLYIHMISSDIVYHICTHLYLSYTSIKVVEAWDISMGR